MLSLIKRLLVLIAQRCPCFNFLFMFFY
jgi:hypothetical protein